MKNTTTLKEAIQKTEHFCAYQERCHNEVITKLRGMMLNSDEIDQIMAHLIASNYLNEERFARSFARGKHRIKQWGKIRIVNELKMRNISQPNIKCALSEIEMEDYYVAFQALAEKHWDSLLERNALKKRKKFCDYLLRKGWESDLIYEKVKELENL